jgi:hypothetical protein
VDTVEDAHFDGGDRSAHGCPCDLDFVRETVALARTPRQDVATQDTLHDVHVRAAAVQSVFAVAFSTVK